MSILQDSAILVRSTFSYFNGIVKEPIWQDKVTAEVEAKRGKVLVKKRILADWRELNQARNIVQQGYLEHIKLTVPWYDNGYRFVHPKKIFDYGDMIKKAKDDLRLKMESVRETYDAAVASDRPSLGKMGENFVYPSVDEIISNFRIESVWPEFSTKGDFRVEIPEQYLEDTKKKLNEVEQLVKSDIYQRMLKSVEHIKEQCSKENGRIFDSMVANMQELAENVEYLNVFKDPTIEVAGESLSQIVDGVTSEKLRVSDATKKEVVEKAEQWLNDYGHLV